MKKHHLTGNDIAIAESGAQLAIAWWKEQPGRSQFKRDQIAAYDALIKKLSAISDFAYPHSHSDEIPLTLGRERIMRADASVTKKTRSAALRARSSMGE